MSSKRLFILIEGDDDERLFKNILIPKFEEKYNYVQLWQYSQETKKRINNFLNSINSMNADYLFITDINDHPCINSIKNSKINKYSNLDAQYIRVVIKEIESWYIAGLSNYILKKFKIKNINNTNGLTKEKFNQLMPRRFSSKIDFMQEILKYFNTNIAKNKNDSIKYFFEKSFKI